MIYQEKPEDFVPQFTAVGCFVECHGKILQLLRSNTAKVEPCKWGCPAGGVNRGEDATTAMLRELKEETGLLAGAKEIRYFGKIYVDYPLYHSKFVYILFRITYQFQPEIILSTEHQAFVWIPPSSAYSLVLMEDELACIQLVYRI